MLSKGASASIWLWIIGGLVVAMLTFTFTFQSLVSVGETSRRNEIVDSYTDIVNTAKLYCSKGTGSLTTEEISLSGVRAIYAAENKGNPPARTPKYVSSSQTSTGNYICLKFKKTSNPYACRQISCEINMTYIGTPLKGTNMYKLGKEDGSFEYNLEIIKKERKIRIKASHYP